MRLTSDVPRARDRLADRGEVIPVFFANEITLSGPMVSINLTTGVFFDNARAFLKVVVPR